MNIPEYRDFVEVLNAQILLFTDLAREERTLADAVVAKDWPTLDRVIRVMNEYSEEIVRVDEERSRTYDALRSRLGLRSVGLFSELLDSVPFESREHLSHLFRELKIAVMRVRSLTGGVDAYVESSNTTLRSVLQELYPERKGRLYSRSGASTEHPDTPVVVNHHL
ncbi:MAG: hypothetical protein EA426_07080 [Spirochaetaceae bacterium]|nr:MAG: hypothetical protein EA426_07080 [Spirochaetaceae bacterium]